MRPQTKSLLLFLTLLGLSLIAFFIASTPSEPSYAGRTLTQWLDAYNEAYLSPNPAETKKQARQAFAQIGTNAVPQFKRLLKYRPSTTKDVCIKFLNNVAGQLHLKWRARDKAMQRSLVVLDKSGAWPTAQAREFIPELTAIFTDPKAAKLTRRASEVLITLGPDGLPLLMLALTNGSTECALIGLRELRTNALPAVPLMIDCLKNPQWEIAVSALYALFSTKADPKVIVPLITGTLQHPSADVRREAAHLLRECGTNALPAVPALFQCLRDTNAMVVVNATGTLGSLGLMSTWAHMAMLATVSEDYPGHRIFLSGPNSCVPGLLKGLTSTNTWVASCSAYVLARLRLDPDVVVPALASRLEDQRAEVRHAAAVALDSYAGPITASVSLMDTVEPAIFKCLTDLEVEVRQCATNLLLEIQMGRARALRQ